jgi:indolepyruvate ferredoxin oxidoreductase beta subunit
MLTPTPLNVFLCGVGGQGVMTAADLIAQAAVAHGFDCKKSEIAGISQRGGVVTSQVRFGAKVLSAVISPGAADLLLAFELAEAFRAATYLKRSGIALVNWLRLPPPVVSLGLYRYPDDPLAELRAAGICVYGIDAGGIARGLHDLRLVNTVMLGAAACFLPFPVEDLESLVIERFAVRKPALVVANRQAFAAGRIAAEKMRAGG